MNKQLFIWDLETYPNFFLAVFKCIVTDKYHYFEISDRKSDQINLKKFLNEQVKGLIGFNNLNFDYPVLHNTILKSNKLLTAQEIYKQVEIIINTKYSAIWDNQIKIPQLDLYRIWHYDNKNKSTSLKWLEFAMRLPNVEDLPYKPGTILTFDQMDEIIAYCKNDIEATEKFYNLSSKHIEIRKFYTQLEGMNLINASEIRMSKEIFGKYLSKEMNIDIKTLSKLRTERSEVDIKDIIFDYLKFNDPLNQEVLEKFNSYKWIDTSNMSAEQSKKYSISFSKPYKNVVREYAEGGLHSFGKAGIYESDDEYVLVDVWATWCGPCRQISPIVDQISSDFQGRLSVGKLDADANREIVAELGVRNIPTLIIFKNGEVLEKSSGMTTLEKLTELINSHLN